MFIKKVIGLLIVITASFSFIGCAAHRGATTDSLNTILSIDLDSLTYVAPDTVLVEGEKFSGEHEITKNGVIIRQKQNGENSTSVTSDGKLIVKKYFHQEEKQIIDLKKMFENMLTL